MQLLTDINTMPIKVFMRFQKYVMIEQGIGSNVTDFDKHFNKMYEYISYKKNDEALKECMNLRNLFFNLVEKEQDIKLYAIASVTKGNENFGEDEITDYVNNVLKNKNVEEIYTAYYELKKKLLTIA